MENYKNFFHAFLETEKKYNCLTLKDNGIHYRELIRFELLENILTQKGVYRKRNYNVFKNILVSLKTIFSIPYFIKKNKLLIEKNPHKKLINNKQVDIFFDYFIKDIPYKKEIGLLIASFKQEVNTKYINPFYMIAKLLPLPVKLDKINKKILQNIEDELEEKLNVKLNLIKFTQKKIKEFKIFSFFIKHFINPKLFDKIIFTVGYTIFNKALINEAKKVNTPIIELQHGVISKYHLGYSTGYQKTKLHYFPDYLLTWGEYWNNVCSFPQNTKLIAVGFPHFEEQKKKIKINQKKENILVISQGTIGNQLFEKTIELAKVLRDFTFFYKLHPSENLDEYKQKLNKLNIKNINLIGGEKNVYELFGICKTQIGVYSTALYEGLGFGLNTIVFDLPGVEYLDDLIEKGYIKKAKNVNEARLYIINQFNISELDENLFFKKNSIDNILNFLIN